jgi:hypothetical protein
MSAKFVVVEMDTFPVAEGLLRGILRGPDPAIRRRQIANALIKKRDPQIL